MLLGKVYKLYNIDIYTFRTSMYIITTTLITSNSKVIRPYPLGVRIYNRL